MRECVVKGEMEMVRDMWRKKIGSSIYNIPTNRSALLVMDKSKIEAEEDKCKLFIYFR